MNSLTQDLRYGVRMLLKTPSVTLVAVLTLALGIGANATMFGIVDAMLIRAPAHVQEPESVVRVYGKGNWTAPTRSYPDYLDLRDGTSSFSSVAAYQNNRFQSRARHGSAANQRAAGDL
ncbi:MAG: ABC transporter permease [Pyrinomonadaceae bacterium]